MASLNVGEYGKASASAPKPSVGNSMSAEQVPTSSKTLFFIFSVLILTCAGQEVGNTADGLVCGASH
jgi:hypothetical protein